MLVLEINILELFTCDWTGVLHTAGTLASKSLFLAKKAAVHIKAKSKYELENKHLSLCHRLWVRISAWHWLGNC